MTEPGAPLARGDAGAHGGPAEVRPSDAGSHARGSEPFGLPAPFAGLILLHPFLPRFFDQAGVRRSGRPSVLEPDDLPQAAALLHACASTDEGEPLEPRLTFIKVLLGLQPETPLLVGGGLLTAADHAEVDGLLRAVIDHFTALKRTSPGGLRATFLSRRGLIRRDAHGFRLQVEPAAFDVLLPQLPWGFGVVKLPWMGKAIVTDWPTP